MDLMSSSHLTIIIRPITTGRLGVHERSGYILAVYRRDVNSETERREGIYSLLRDVDIEFVCCPLSDRNQFRVKVAGII